MNTYMLRLGIKDTDGNNLYYVADSARNFSASKEEAFMKLCFYETISLTTSLLQNKKIQEEKGEFLKHWANYHPDSCVSQLSEVKFNGKSIPMYATEYRPIVDLATNTAPHYIRIGYLENKDNRQRKYYWWLDTCGAYIGKMELSI